MADQIIVFKSGERVITDLQEVFEGEGEERRGICLVMKNPYILELVAVNDMDDSTNDLQVKFSKWCPYSVDYQFRIPYDSILAIGEPDTGLAQAYRNKIASLVATQETGVPPAPPQTPAEAVEEGWAEGATNPNMEAQLTEIRKNTGGAIPPDQVPTAGVGGAHDEHPVAEPFAVEADPDAQTAEV
tara:strand:- start:1147 stop:1704 length:558 start_codon:yes stop_codon:yes gene_type:complete